MAVKVHLSRILGERKMKIAELSRLTGLSQHGLLHIYHERTNAISFAILNRLCEVLQVQVCDLLEYVPDKKQENREEKTNS